MPVAVKVTDVPGQMVVADAKTETVGVTVSFTVMMITLLVAVAGKGHVAFDVTITVTLSPFTRDEELNVVPPEPTFTPFTCH